MFGTVVVPNVADETPRCLPATQFSVAPPPRPELTPLITAHAFMPVIEGFYRLEILRLDLTSLCRRRSQLWKIVYQTFRRRVPERRVSFLKIKIT